MKQERMTAAEYRKSIGKPQSHKMHNTKLVVDGKLYPSIRQANHYQELKLMKRQGLIIDFLEEHNFPLTDGYYLDEKWVRPEVYRADFVVIRLVYNPAAGIDPEVRLEIHEPKGHRTRTYKNKKKLFMNKYPEYQFFEI